MLNVEEIAAWTTIPVPVLTLAQVWGQFPAGKYCWQIIRDRGVPCCCCNKEMGHVFLRSECSSRGHCRNPLGRSKIDFFFISKLVRMTNYSLYVKEYRQRVGI